MEGIFGAVFHFSEDGQVFYEGDGESRERVGELHLPAA
jgi:hypothetical protein